MLNRLSDWLFGKSPLVHVHLVALDPSKRYVVFVNPQVIDLLEMGKVICSVDVTVIPCIPPHGKTVADCVVAVDRSQQIFVDGDAIVQ